MPANFSPSIASDCPHCDGWGMLPVIGPVASPGDRRVVVACSCVGGNADVACAYIGGQFVGAV